MLNIGCHLSTSKGFYNAALEALSIRGNAYYTISKDLPFNLETPNELEGNKKEIGMLRKEYGQ